MNFARTALLATSTLVVAASPAMAQAKTYNVPEQAAASGIAALGRQADIQIIAARKYTQGRQTNAVRGMRTVDQALDELLAGTGLTARRSGAGTYMVLPLPTTSRLSAQPASRQAADAASVSQPDSVALEPDAADIVVTAQKREERLQDVPVPVAVVKGEDLLHRNQTRLQDYYATVPGLSYEPGGRGEPSLAIRGVRADYGSNPSVGITVDDVPYGSTSGTGGGYTPPDIDPNDLAQIEILRGPQGTLYGANSLGGLIKFVTVDPSPAGLSGRIQAGIVGVRNGDGLGYNVRGAVNLPISPDAAIRISGFTRQDPGYIDAPNLGISGINGSEAYGGRASVLLKPSTDLTIKLGALYQKQKIEGTSLSTLQPGLGSLEQVSLRGTGQLERETQVYSANIRYELGGLELVSVTGYNIGTIDSILDFTPAFGAVAEQFLGVAGAAIPYDLKSRKFSQELRVSGDAGDFLDWTIGGFFTDENAPARQDIVAVDPATGTIVGALLEIPYRTKYKEHALFGHVTFNFTDRFDVQLGARQSWIDQEYVQTNRGLLSPVETVTNGKAQASPFTYLVTPRFRVSDDLMIYGRLASGFRAGGPTPNAAVLNLPPQYDPDTTTNYELGLKGSALGRTLFYEASIYRIDWNDIQLLIVDPSQLSYIGNGGRAKSEGVEFSLDARPVKGLSINGWVAYNNARLAEDLPLGSSVQGEAGDRLPGSSKWSAHGAVDYRFGLSGDLSASFGASVSYVGQRVGNFVGSPSQARRDLPGYIRLDLRAGLEIDDWRLDAFLNNVSDKRGVLGDQSGIVGSVLYIQPRSIGLNLTRNF
jgi:outer membrane receptor protein involved in Fe transport